MVLLTELSSPASVVLMNKHSKNPSVDATEGYAPLGDAATYGKLGNKKTNTVRFSALRDDATFRASHAGAGREQQGYRKRS